MDIKCMIRIEKFRNKVSRFMEEISQIPEKKINSLRMAASTYKYQKRVAYNQKITEKELVKRLLRTIVKNAIYEQIRTLEFYWCEKDLDYKLMRGQRFILDELIQCYDKNLKHWLEDNDIYCYQKSVIGDLERRLHLELLSQCKEAGFDTYYDFEREQGKNWAFTMGYTKSLIIKLPK